MEETFIRQNIPYRLIGATRFYSRKEIKDVLGFLRLVHTSDDDVSFMRVVNVPPRGIGARTLAVVSDEASTLDSSRYQGLLSVLKQKKLSTRASQSLNTFAVMLETWRALQEQVPVAQLLDRILTDTGYEGYIRDGSDEGESRWENIQALRCLLYTSPSPRDRS